VLVFSFLTTVGLSGCSTAQSVTVQQEQVSSIADKVWQYSLSHPDGFTLDIRTMKAPREGIAVSYAETQDSYSREHLNHVVSHALHHGGYVGGWHDKKSGRYYFDSSRLFPEDSLQSAQQFAKANGQYAIYVLSTDTVISVLPHGTTSNAE